MDRVKANNTITRELIDSVNALIDRQNEVDSALIDALGEEDVCTCGPDQACGDCPDPDECSETCDIECYAYHGLVALVTLANEAKVEYIRLAAAKELASFAVLDGNVGFLSAPKCW